MKDSDKLDTLLTNIDKMRDDIVEIKVDLATHIKRTDLAEQNLEMLRKDFKPVRSHVTLMNNLAKIVAATAGILLFLNEMGWLSWIKITLP